MTRDNPYISRRTALQTVAGAALGGVAGCLDGNTAPNDEQGSSDDAVFQQVAVDGTAVVVELSSDAAVDQINLIQPNGELFGQREVATGSQQVSFEIGTSYPIGEYEVVAVNEEETVAKISRSIEPDLEIVEMGVGRNQPQKMWNGTKDEINEEAFIVVENRGSGPDSITKLLFLGDVPFPSDEEGTNYADNKDVSGIYDPESGSEVNSITIDGGERLTIFSFRSPFAFVPGAGTPCTDETQNGEFELIIETTAGRNQISRTYNIRYTAAEEPGNCGISIRGETND